MAILKREDYIQPKKVIDLSGPEGNAYVLMGYAKSVGKQLGYENKDINGIINEMMSGDYENLINVFDKHFGMVIDLVR